jgi:predicted metal-dependent hydrolase
MLCRIIRSRRRTIAIIITADAEVVVRAPHRMPEGEIEKFVAGKQKWIEACQKLPARCRELGELTGYRPARVRISAARTRWGSCSPAGSISLNWRLAMAPQAVIDYVIIHELAHLAEMNHSARFWRRVEQHVPDHRQHRRWLRQNGRLFSRW